MMPSNSGSGRRCNDIIDAICELAGIRDLKAKVHGSHHPHNTVRAVFEALASMQSCMKFAALEPKIKFRKYVKINDAFLTTECFIAFNAS